MKHQMALMIWLGALSLQGQPYPRPGPVPYQPGSGTATAQSPLASAYEMEFASLQIKVDRLGRTLGQANEEAGHLLTSIRTNAAFLRLRWQDWLKNNRDYGSGAGSLASDKYLRSLIRNNELLKKTEKQRDPALAVGLLRDIALDMEVKADNCRNSKDGLGKVIRVKVRTLRGGQEAPGYEVWFVQKGMYDVKSAHDRFRKQSSPTDERELWPGGYALWARKGESESQPTTVRLGGRGDTRIEIDLEVP